jgi:hypothetical protein
MHYALLLTLMLTPALLSAEVVNDVSVTTSGSGESRSEVYLETTVNGETVTTHRTEEGQETSIEVSETVRSGGSGTRGMDGADGTAGAHGTAGTSGTDGAPGEDGSAGTSGTAGDGGLDGAPGQGAAGAPPQGTSLPTPLATTAATSTTPAERSPATSTQAAAVGTLISDSTSWFNRLFTSLVSYVGTLF